MSVVLPCFLATKPKSLGEEKARGSERFGSTAHPRNTTTTLFHNGLVHLPLFNIHIAQQRGRQPKLACMKTHLFFPLPQFL